MTDKKRRQILCALGVALAALLPAPAAAQETVLRISGSSTLAPLVTELAKRFRALNPNVRIVVEAGGSGRGVADARSGKSDIGMVSRTLKADAATRAIPVIVVTAYLSEHPEREARAAGAAGYIAKPYHYKELLAAVMAALKG